MKRVPARLLIIGNGPLEPSLKKQVEESGLSDKVTILPSVPDLVPYYRACDVFALSSCENSEVFGIVQIEAMACGKPVVNTALPTGVPEVSVDGQSGYTVRPKSSAELAEALRMILADAGTYDYFSKSARQDVELRFCRRTMFASLDLALADSFSGILGQDVEHSARQLAPAA
jgi:rhamnosyl/mannosyltransferase